MCVKVYYTARGHLSVCIDGLCIYGDQMETYGTKTQEAVRQVLEKYGNLDAFILDDDFVISLMSYSTNGIGEILRQKLLSL